MSFTSIYKNSPELRKWFRDIWPKVPIKLNNEIIVGSFSGKSGSGLIGTAFDYLFRFHLESINDEHKIIKKTIIAEEFVENSGLIKDEKVRQIIDQYHNYHSKLLKREISIVDMCDVCLNLATIDIVYRTGFYFNMMGESNIGRFSKECSTELKNLSKTLDNKRFIAKESIILNPTFKDGSDLVNGADADLIFDKTLIEIKTSKDLKTKRATFDQLISYFLLSKIGNVFDIENIAVYFARYGEIWTISISELFKDRILNNDVEDFKKTIISCKRK